jgi:hypothetical protein
MTTTTTVPAVLDKLAGSVPLRILTVQGYSLPIRPLWSEEPLDGRYERLVQYESELREKQRVLPTIKVPTQHLFSTWDWDSTSTTPGSCPSYAFDHPALVVPSQAATTGAVNDRRSTITATGTIAQVMAWERLNLQWNMAALKGQEAAITPVERRCSVLKTVLEHIDVCLNILSIEHHELAAALSGGPPQGQSLMTNPAFLRTWSAFIQSRLQRCSHSYILTKTSDMSRFYAGSAAAGAIAMSNVLISLELVDETLRSTVLLTIWKEACQGWEKLFRAYAEYHESFVYNDQVRLQRLRAVCVHVEAFTAVCNHSQTGILAGLQESCRERLDHMVRHAESVILADPATLADLEVQDPPPITPRFYHPDGHNGGYYYDKFSLKRVFEEERDGNKPSRTYVKLRDSSGPTITAPKPNAKPDQNASKPETMIPPLDLVEACQEAKQGHKWVLVAIYANNAPSLAFRQAITTNEFIADTIRHGFVLRHRPANHAQSFVADYGVTQFPFVAIFEPHSMTIRWSCSDWSESDSLIAERLADKLLNYNGSYDPYEGLADATNVPEGCEPPTHLVFTAGGFRAALQEAEATNRWMLVNLQTDSALASHCLNRDVWRDEAVSSIVKENFVFWQKVCISTFWPLISTNFSFVELSLSTARRIGRG